MLFLVLPLHQVVSRQAGAHRHHCSNDAGQRGPDEGGVDQRGSHHHGDYRHDVSAGHSVGGFVMLLAAQHKDGAEGQEVLQQCDHGEVTQKIRQAGGEDQNDSHHALNNDGERGGLVFGMHLAKLLEEQSVTRHRVLDAGLEHDAAGQRADHHDDGHDRNHHVGALADYGDLGGQQRDGRIGRSQLIDAQQAGSYEGQAHIQAQNDQRGKNQTTGHILLGLFDLAGHVAGSAHAVKRPSGGGDTGQQRRDSGDRGARQRSGRQQGGSIHEEQSYTDNQYKGQNFQGGDEGLELAASLHTAQMHHHEHQHENRSNDLQHDAVHGQEVSQVVNDRQRHNGDGRGIGGPEADPTAQEGQRAGPGFTEVNILTTILRECGSQFCVAEVGRYLKQTADQEGKHQEQAASRGIGHLRQRREDTGTNGGADAQCDHGAQS